MKIHHLRSATFIIEAGPYFILIDPMLGDKVRFLLFHTSALGLKRIL